MDENETPENGKIVKANKASQNGTDLVGNILSLSPEQKKRIEVNKSSARMKLLSKTSDGLLVNIGPSWCKALESEFSKPYFTEVWVYMMYHVESKIVFQEFHAKSKDPTLT